jgi:hypothetical protein
MEKTFAGGYQTMKSVKISPLKVSRYVACYVVVFQISTSGDSLHFSVPWVLIQCTYWSLIVCQVVCKFSGIESTYNHDSNQLNLDHC